MSAAVLNLVGDDSLEQGVPYTLQLNLDDGAKPTPGALNLTGWEIVGMITQPCGGTFSVPFSVSIPTPTNGIVLLNLTEEQLAGLPASAPGEAGLKIDILGTPSGGTPLHLITGKVCVKPTPTSLL